MEDLFKEARSLLGYAMLGAAWESSEEALYRGIRQKLVLLGSHVDLWRAVNRLEEFSLGSQGFLSLVHYSIAIQSACSDLAVEERKTKKTIYVLPDALDLTLEGGVIAANLINLWVAEENDESVGYIVPNKRTNDAMAVIKQLVEDKAAEGITYGELHRRIVAQLGAAANNLHKVQLSDYYSSYYPQESPENLTTIVPKEVVSDVAMSRVDEFNERLISQRSMKAATQFISNYKVYMAKLVAQAKNIAGDNPYWRVFGYSRSVGDLAPFDDHSLDEMITRIAVPRTGTLVLHVFGGDEGNILRMSFLYTQYVFGEMELSYYERTMMIDALVYMMDRMSEHLTARRVLYVMLRFLVMSVDLNGQYAGDAKEKFLPMPVDKYLKWATISINQMQAPTAEAIQLMKEVGEKTELAQYGLEITDSTREFVDPFWFQPIMIIPPITLLGHAAVLNKKAEFLRLECSESEDGECLEKACSYMQPAPTKEEMDVVRMRSADPVVPLSSKLLAVTSLPWLVVDTPKKDGDWGVLACYPGGMAEAIPSSIDLTKVMVLCERGSHMYRVTRIVKPECRYAKLSEARLRGDRSLAGAIGEAKDVVFVQKITSNGKLKLENGEIVRAEEVDLVEKTYVMKFDGAWRKIEEVYAPKGVHQRENYFASGALICKVCNSAAENSLLAALTDTVNESSISEETAAELRALPEITIGRVMEKLEELKTEPSVLLVEPTESSWNILRSSSSLRPTPVEYLTEHPEIVVLARNKKTSQYSRVVSYRGPVAEDGQVVYCDVKGWFAVKRGETNEKTLEMCGSYLEKEEYEEILSGAYRQREKCIFVDKFGKDECGNLTVFQFQGTEVPDVDPSKQAGLWVDGDGTLWHIEGESDYFLMPKQEKVKIPPFVVSYDAETANSSNYATKSKTNVLLMCAKCSDGTAKVFKGAGATDAFVEWLDALRKKVGNGRKILCVGFNSSGFDIYPVIEAIVNNFRLRFGYKNSHSRVVKAHSRFLEVVYENITFHDVRRYLAQSLKMAALNLRCKGTKSCWSHRKTQLTFQKVHCDIPAFYAELASLPASDFMVCEATPTASQREKDAAEEEYVKALQDVENKTAEQAFIDYCLNDCEVTLEVFGKLKCTYAAITNGEIDLSDCITAPQAVYKYAMKNAKKQLYLCKSAEELEFTRNGILAGRSQRFSTAPYIFASYHLLMVDTTSQYPTVLHQCPFPLDSAPRKVKEFVPGLLGIYRVRVTKQASPPIIPLKGKESKLGAHFWDWQGEFEATVTSVHILDHLACGGECEILEGYVYSASARGVLTDAIEVFKKSKQEQDVYKNDKKLKHLYNPAIRQVDKDSLNGLTGKFVEEFVRDDLSVVAGQENISKKLSKLRKKYGENNVAELPLCREDGDVVEQLTSPHKTRLITAKVDYERFFSETAKSRKKSRSLVAGIFIYAWSQHHMLWSIMKRAYDAGACYATETDSLMFDREKYERWMEAHMPQYNPYDVPAPSEEILPDKCFDMSLEGEPNPLLKNQRMGYFYCPDAAAAWFSEEKNKKLWFAHNDRPWAPSHSPDFGDFTVESGVANLAKAPEDPPDLRFEDVQCCFLGKKSYYVAKTVDGPKMRYKGIGKSTKDASELMAYLAMYKQLKLTNTFEFDPKYKAIVDRIDLLPSIVSPELFIRLSNGEGVDVCEHRFSGLLGSIQEDGTTLHSCFVTKRIQPPIEYKLVVRTRKSEKNPHGNDVYEQQYPGSEPKGKPPCKVSLNGERVTQTSMRLIMEKF